MARVVTIKISDAAAGRAQEAAARSHRRVEDVLAEWIDVAALDAPVETLSNDQVLALCQSTLASSQQDELSELLARNREGSLTSNDRSRFDALMSDYRRGLTRKAQALQVAVARNLITPLG